MKRIIPFALLLTCSITHAYRDTETGTFLTRDPAGHADGPNLYCYVHCNPITQFDALGLMTESQASDDAQDYYDENYEGDQNFDEWYEENQEWWYEQLSSDGYTIYKDDFSEVVMESSASEQRKSAFIVMGNAYQTGKKHDPEMFRRASKSEIADLKAQGVDVNIFDAGKGEQGNPAEVVKNGLQNIRQLETFSMYFHGGMDINLDRGKGFWSEKSEGRRMIDPVQRLRIDSLTAGHPTINFNVNLYGCAGYESSTYGQEMANTLGVNVKGAPAGAGLVFPLGTPMPKFQNQALPTSFETYYPYGVDQNWRQPIPGSGF